MILVLFEYNIAYWLLDLLMYYEIEAPTEVANLKEYIKRLYHNIQ